MGLRHAADAALEVMGERSLRRYWVVTDLPLDSEPGMAKHHSLVPRTLALDVSTATAMDHDLTPSRYFPCSPRSACSLQAAGEHATGGGALVLDRRTGAAVADMDQIPAASTCWKKPRAAALQKGGTKPPW